MKKNTYILGIDGGGTSTNAVLFDSCGNTLCENSSEGSNLYVYKEQAIQKIFNLLNVISNKSKISLEEISAIGVGVAGVSDLNHRELLLKELDRLKLSDMSLICSDTEAAYHVLCPSGEGILVSVGTGVVCMGVSNEQNVRIAGKGHDKGDVGSGYWIGNKVIKMLILNQNLLDIESEMIEIFDLVKEKFEIDSLDSLGDIAQSNDLMYLKTALLAKDVILLAEKGNDLALSILQEATTHVADYIIDIYNKLNLDSNSIMLAGNGNVIKNNFYRNLLNDALQFDFKKIHWIFSELSPAYGAGLLAAKYNKINIDLGNIVKNKKT